MRNRNVPLVPLVPLVLLRHALSSSSRRALAFAAWPTLLCLIARLPAQGRDGARALGV